MVALSSPVRCETWICRMENSEYRAADSRPRAMPSRYRTSRLNTSRTPAMAMKLISTSAQDSRFRFRSGSRMAVKKQEVAMQATPMETFDAWMLAKNATQCKARMVPQPAMRRTERQPVRCRRPIRAITAARTGTLTIIRYHTKGSPPRVMSRPRIPVHPARKTAVWSRIMD